jgi:hypothetical protein
MTTPHACTCRHPPFWFVDYYTVHLGEDSHGADISHFTCKHCGATWLMYLIEEPHYSRSGRWWRVEIKEKNTNAVSAATARQYIERSAAGFAGGSYFNSQGHAITAPIKVS